jgi:hypothetical protein
MKIKIYYNDRKENKKREWGENILPTGFRG